MVPACIQILIHRTAIRPYTVGIFADFESSDPLTPDALALSLSKLLQDLLQKSSHRLLQTPVILEHPFSHSRSHVMLQSLPNLPTGHSPIHSPVILSHSAGHVLHSLPHTSPNSPRVQLLQTPVSFWHPLSHDTLHILSQCSPYLPIEHSLSHTPLILSHPIGQVLHCLSQTSP